VIPLFLPIVTAFNLAGCWKPYGDLTSLDFTAIAYENEYLVASDVVISSFDTKLICPDGEKARFYAVYREHQTENAPVAIVLHAGAFDFVHDTASTSTYSGDNYRSDSRLNRNWAVSKIWETLGINPNPVDAAESNLGTLPAALADNNMVQLYPGNCWGDLWHNQADMYNNDVSIDGFSREGRTLANTMVQIIIEQSYAGELEFSVPVNLDRTQIYLIGLGEGGRGVAEILEENAILIQGVFLDSSPENLLPFVQDPDVYEEEVTGLERIFFEEDLDDIDQWSIDSIEAIDKLPERVGFFWSDADPRQPSETMAETAEILSDVEGAFVWNSGQAGHIFLNGDQSLARHAVDYLLTGEIPPEYEVSEDD